MEAKIDIMTVLLLSLVMGQIQVEAKSCCPSTTARNIYNACISRAPSKEICARLSGCKHVDGKCPQGWDKDILENSGDVVNKYCKLGCASSVCGAITSLQNSDASEIVNGVVQQCTKACSAICNKGSITALEIV